MIQRKDEIVDMRTDDEMAYWVWEPSYKMDIRVHRVDPIFARMAGY
jgi:hypothetical protein